MRMVEGYGTAGGLQTCPGYSSPGQTEPIQLAAELCRAEPSLQSSDIRDGREELDRVLPL
jgi:hypothetical protein